MARRGGRDRCPYDGKSTFKSRKRANRTARRLEDANLYWCPQAGGWHLTSLEPGEYDHRRALGMRGELETEMDLHAVGQVMLEQAALDEKQSGCPVCQEPAGFHNSTIHAERIVPRDLTWKAGGKAPWEEKQ
jgi:hypothetical protein